MTTRRVHTALLMVVGSFLVYCGQHSTNPDGFAGDANAEGTCCTVPAPVFTKLGEGDISPSQSSPVFAIGAYREIVVYMTPSEGSCTSAAGISLVPQFSANSGDGFGATGQRLSLHAGGRLRIDGNEVKLTVSNPGNCTPSTGHYIIAGVL